MAITRSILPSSRHFSSIARHRQAAPLSSACSPFPHSCQSIKIVNQIHAHAIVSSSRFASCSGSAASKFISLYSNFGCLQNAVSPFDALVRPDTLAWNAIIKAHVDLGLGSEALFLYRKMRQSGVQHDSFTFPMVNKAVTLTPECDVGVDAMVHCVACKLGFGSDLYFCNTMMEVYAKGGSVLNASKLFDEMPLRDLVSWTSMITAFISEGNVSYAFQLFSKMRKEIEPNSVTLIVMLQGCSTGTNWAAGRQLHGYLVKNGLLADVSLQNSLLRMYSNMDRVEMVENLFCEMKHRDVVSWNTVISFYSLTEDIGKVASFFNQMQLEVAFTSETLSSVITALGKAENLTEGQSLHSLATKCGLNDHVLMTSFLDFYAKCGKPENSAALFTEISHKSSITWTAMMSGFVQNGLSQQAVETFRQMQAAGIKPGPETLGTLVDACAHLTAFHLGKEIHGYLTKNLFPNSAVEQQQHLSLTTSILNMYIRCGTISSARQLFDRMPTKDTVAWTSMIDGYGIHGLGIEALNLFHTMLEERSSASPNSITFLSLLSSCSHSGLVREGFQLFTAMKHVHGIEPSLDHYTCLVDLLARSGNLKQALSMILKMEACRPPRAASDGTIWGALLAAATTHGNRRISEYAATKVLELEPDGVGYHTLLSNVRAGGGEWCEAEEVRRGLREKMLKKEPGWSFLEARETVNHHHHHRFVAGDQSHGRIEEICEVLRHLSYQVCETVSNGV